MSMQSQWEFYKIAQKSAVSIKNQVESFLEDLWIEFCNLWKIQYRYPGMNFDSTCIIAHNDQRQPLKA